MIDEKLQALLETLDRDDPAQAAILRRTIQEMEEQSDGAKLTVKTKFRLEKFDGDYEPGKEPVEIITGGDGIETTRIK